MSDKPHSPRSHQSGEEDVHAAVLAFQKGIEREKNFEFLVARFYGPVFRFLARRRYSEQDRLDITQEVFLNVYRGLKEFRGEAQFGTWVFKIAVNTFNRWHKQGRHEASGNDDLVADELDDETLYSRVVPFLGSPLETLIAEERSTRLRRGIASLPAQMRRCVELNVYRDMRYPEIAASLGISVGTVKAQLFHARQRLRCFLVAEPGEDEGFPGGSR
jgi:RNA polymerase sigma-70 factor (ECF subfamily)